jgi:hypothetical protein
LPYAPGSAAGAGFKQLVGRAVASYKQAKTEALKASQQLKDL